MNKTILVLSRSPDLLLKIEDQLKAGGYQTLGVTKDKDALNHLRDSKVDGLLISGGVELGSRKSIIYYTEFNRPTIKIILHKGGAFKLLETVQKALS